MYTKLFSILLFLFSFSAHSTLYTPVPVKQQIKESDAIIEGTFLAKKSILYNAQVVTALEFRIDKQVSLKEDEKNTGILKVLVPGGELAGRKVEVHGLPGFKRGESSILFLKRSDDRFWLMNLAAGKYRIEKLGETRVFVSEIFPYHPRAGQILEQDFFKKVKRYKGEIFAVLKTVQHGGLNRGLASAEKLSEGPSRKKSGSVSSTVRLDRNIASVGKTEEEEKAGSGVSLFWLIIALGLLGGAAQIIAKRKSE